MAKTYEQMDLQELEQENLRLMREQDAIRAKRVRINEVMTEKQAEADAQRRLATLSDAEKRALMQLIQSDSVQARAKAGEMGNGG